MDDLHDALDRLMSDPAEFQRLSRMAQDLLGGGQEGEDEPPPGPDLGALLRAVKTAPDSDTQKLLGAMKPFLARRRQEKLGRAMRLARLASVAELALGQMGGEDDDDTI